MKKAFVFASISLTVLMIFTANSAVGAGWGSFYLPQSVATAPWNILGENDGYVTSLGNTAEPNGSIYVIFNETFKSGDGWDIRIHGYDVDGYPEQYRVYLGEWDEVNGSCIILAPNELYYDTDGTVYFDFGDPEEPIVLNMIVLKAYAAVIPGGVWPGPEIDAVYARY